MKTSKNLKVFALIIVTSMLLLVAAVPTIQSVNAQTTYTVSMFSSCAGTTTPAGSYTAEVATYTYAAGSTQTFTATASSDFAFCCWIIGAASGPTTSTQNPLSYTVNANTGLQPVFVPSGTPAATPTPTSTPATEAVLVFASYGGSSTPTGTATTAPYVLYNDNTGSSQTFTATPGSGFKLLCWIVVSGIAGTTSTDTTLTTTITAATAIQPVFIPTSSTVTLPGSATPTPTATATPPPSKMFSGFTVAVDAIIAVVIIIVAIISIFAYMRMSKKKA